ncbi:MAG: sigma-54 dependent transcriptional regulator [Acidobacteriota bacterium]
MSEEGARIVVVDDDDGGREPLVRSLEKIGHEVIAFQDGESALAGLDESSSPDLLITDLRMPGIGGLELLKRLKARWPTLPAILITAHGSISSSFEAGRLGAEVYLEKPLDIHELRRRVAELLARNDGDADDEVLPGILGKSPSMRELADQVRRVAPTQATVLILGESGTGKDLVARAVHELSPASDGNFLPLNCAAIPGHLLESELFGHERGAFTGADRRQLGKFEIVGDGTLFLDEIGELALDLQAKLLRVLEDRRFMRVGGSEALDFKARLVAASNRELSESVERGEFREDLFYRLRVVNLIVPPLRERRGDFELLVHRFLQHFADHYSKGSLRLSKPALAALSQSRFEGNVRELKNLVESLVVLSRGGEIGLEDLPPNYRKAASEVAEPAAIDDDAAGGEPRTMDAIERDAILAALRDTEGNRERAAKQLGIGLRTLQRKIKEYRDQGFDI